MDRHYKSSSELSKSSKKRSRSRSPIDRKDDKRRHHSKEDYRRRSRSSSSSSSEDDRRKKVKNPPPAPRISMNFNKTASNLSKNTGGIQIKLNAPAKPAPVIQKSTKISNVFNADEDSDPEEMPEYAKMRMRNIGKDTPTSSGPNSFGKTKQGFIDTKKLFERKLKQMADEISND